MRLSDEESVQGQQGAFKYSGIRPERLQSTTYTLVTVAVDISGSTSGFAQDLLDALVSAMSACFKSPMANNLLARYIEFNHDVDEKHGFRPLTDIKTSDYHKPVPRGSTNLFDAMFSSISGLNGYAKTLHDADFDVNGIVFVITDGGDTGSTMGLADIKREMMAGVNVESIESVTGILIGIGNLTEAKMEYIKTESGFAQYVNIVNADPQNLAKLASFVSRSISSTSQSFGSGGPSQPLTF